MVEVIVSRLGIDSATQQYVVVLQEKGGDRYLPIWIGSTEADSDREPYAQHQASAPVHA